MEYYRNPQAPSAGHLVRDTGLLVLRVGVGLVLGIYHAWREVLLGWNFVWKKQSWLLAQTVEDFGLPVPKILACAAAVVMALGAVGLVLGVLSRLSALLLLACAVVGLLFTIADPIGEKLLLYAVACGVIVICGPGCFSIDALLNRKRNA
jgi:uncharacterized membrane protein YphA (DoxX/SURF4 family)